MSMSLYVGNFPYNTTEDQLRELFGQHGSVESVRIINDRETGMSRGFGFVAYATENEAQTAIGELNGLDFNGRALKVNLARPREQPTDRY